MSDFLNSRVLAGGFVTALAAGLAVGGGTYAADAATGPTLSAYGGSSYSSSASVGDVAHSGSTALSVMCTTSTPYGHDTKIASVHLPGSVGDLGAGDNRTSNYVSGGVRTSSASSTTANVHLLEAALPNISADLITGDSVYSLAHSQQLADGTFAASASTTLTNVSIAGEAVAVHPDPNTVINLSELGVKITLNQQGSFVSGAVHESYVNAMVVNLLANNTLGLPAGTVTIGHSIASISNLIFRDAYGTSFAVDANLGSTAVIGRTAPVYLPCGGSGGLSQSNKTASVSAGGLVTAGATDDEGYSSDTSSSTVARTSSKLANANILGKVTVDSVTAESTVTRTPSALYRSTSGTAITGVRINGTLIANPKVGTSRSVAGLGTLYFGRVTNSGPGTTVVGVQLVLSENVGSALKGTVIDVASASAGVTYPTS